MTRVVDTSVGRVVIDFFGDGTLHITLFDADGWEARRGEWGDAELARGLFYVAGVPEDEANAIEREVVPQWVARGGKPEGRWEEEGAWSCVVASAVFVLLLACLVVGVVTVVRWVLALL